MRAIVRIPLQLLLLLLLAVALFFTHGYIAVALSELPGLFQARTLQLAALLSSSLLAAALVAAAFAYPLAKAYPRHAALAAITICIPTVLFRAPHVFETSGKPFVVAALALDIVALLVLVPCGAWLLNRLRPNNSFKPKPLRGSA